jgi:predicted ribosome quality control (RQC) complex YloA/Tae2 family protein
MKTETIFFENIHKSFTFWISENENEPFKMLDLANPKDIWFHAEKESSCHVIVSLGEYDEIDLSKKEIKTIVKRGAFLCKKNTNKLRPLPAKTVSFLYCKIGNIQSTEKAGCVITENTKTIRI